MTERIASALMLIVSVYGGVYSVIEEPSVFWVFILLIPAAVITVACVWGDATYDSE